MMEKLTNKTWETLIKEFIFNPAKMTSCGFGAPGGDSPNLPTQPWPHYQEKDELKSIFPGESYSDNPKAIRPAGIIHCSLKDWLKFAQAHLDGFNGKDTPILKSSSFHYLHKDYKGQGYTSGGFVYQMRNNKVYLGHNGSNTLNFALMILDTHKNAAYLSATNLGETRREKGAQKAMLSMGSPDVCLGNFCLLTKKAL